MALFIAARIATQIMDATSYLDDGGAHQNDWFIICERV